MGLSNLHRGCSSSLSSQVWLCFSHSNWCLDSSMFGYFNTMISGHGPVCYLLLTIAHHAQSNIYQLLPAAFISSGIGYISKKSRGEIPEL